MKRRKKIQIWLHQHHKDISAWALVIIATIIMVGVFQQTTVIKDAIDRTSKKVDTLTYNPLTFDRSQNVKREPPLFHLDDPVAVEAKFVNTDTRTVGFIGAVNWRLISPVNSLSEFFQFNIPGEVPPGCKEFHFDNKPPAEVVRHTERYFADGVKEVVWQIYGNNAIVSPQPGASIDFVTEQFRYIPDNTPLPEHKEIDMTRCDG